MQTRAALIDAIERFLAATGMSEGRFGVAAVGDNKLVARLRAGFGVTLTTIERAEAFMAAHRPANDDGGALPPGGAAMPVPPPSQQADAA